MRRLRRPRRQSAKQEVTPGAHERHHAESGWGGPCLGPDANGSERRDDADDIDVQQEQHFQPRRLVRHASHLQIQQNRTQR